MNESTATTIGLVVDPEFGERISVLAQQMPLWVISSPTNDRVIEKIRATTEANRVTKLLTRVGESRDELLGRAMCAIDEHHGIESGATPYLTLIVYGATLDASQELASDLGFASLSVTAEGFRAEK